MKKVSKVILAIGVFVLMLSLVQAIDIWIGEGNQGVYTHLLLQSVYIEILSFMLISIGGGLFLYDKLCSLEK